MEQQKNLIGGIILGGVVGLVAGLLIAPESGKKMRKMLNKKSTEVRDNLFDKVTDSIDSLKHHFNDKVEEVAGKTKNAVDTAKNQISEKTKTV